MEYDQKVLYRTGMYFAYSKKAGRTIYLLQEINSMLI